MSDEPIIIPEEQSTKLSKSESFKPTPHMYRWLDVAIDIVSDSPIEIELACKQLGTPITRQAWYKWRHVPGFEEWFYAEYKNKRRRWLPTLDKIGMKMAKSDYNFWKDMNKKAGDNLDEKNPVNVQVNAFIGEKRSEYGI
jgi:hypothetical protein